MASYKKEGQTSPLEPFKYWRLSSSLAAGEVFGSNDNCFWKGKEVSLWKI